MMVDDEIATQERLTGKMICAQEKTNEITQLMETYFILISSKRKTGIYLI